MSTSILTTTGAHAGAAPDAGDDVRLTFPRIVRSEWIKFRTLRSTIWTLAIAVLLMVGVALLFAFGVKSSAGQIDAPGASIVTVGYYFGQLTLVVLGVLVISGEYSTGMIRSTFASVPTRLPTLWAKAIILAVSSFLVGIVSVAISYLVTLPILAPLHLVPDLGDREAVRIMVGSALYLTAMALLALAIGALLRHSAAAIASVLGLVLVVENVFQIPLTFFQKVSPFLPSTAGARLMMPQEQIDALAQTTKGAILSPWQGYAVLLVWVVVIMTVAVVLMKRRDA